MPVIAPNPGQFAGRVVGNGHCAPYVQRATRVGLTHTWRRGTRVRGNRIPAGAAIATFVGDGRGGWRYGNRRGGDSHAAIFISQSATGIRVWDQWVGRAVAQRTIQFRGGIGKPVNDGDAFWTIEV